MNTPIERYDTVNMNTNERGLLVCVTDPAEEWIYLYESCSGETRLAEKSLWKIEDTIGQINITERMV